MMRAAVGGGAFVGVSSAVVIADTHGRPLPEACLARLRGAELILHAGDISSVEALEDLLAIGPPLLAVRGNVDEPSLREALPESLELTLGGARVGLVHDAGPARGRLARMRARFPECRAVVFGHSHIPLHERDGSFQIFNPGSATDRRRQAQRTMGLARVREAEPAFELIALGP